MQAEGNAPSATNQGPRFICIGCEADMSHPFATTGADVGPDGMPAPLCRPCWQRAQDSEVFARLVFNALQAGATVPETRRVFARMGLQMPTSRAEALRMMGGV